MKKILLITFALLAFSGNIFPQFGWTKIYDQQFYTIFSAQVFQNQGLTSSKLFIQLGTNNAAQNNDAGRVYRLNKNSLQFYTPFQNGFDRSWYFSGFPVPAFHISMQNPFAVSLTDTTFALRNFVSGCGVDCGDKTYFTTNYGTNWNIIPQLGNDFLGPQSRGYDIDPFNSQIVYSAYPRIGSGNRLIIYKSTNKGSSWLIIDSVQAETQSIVSGYVKINPFRPNYIYIRGSNNLLVSTNSGVGFTPAANSQSFGDLEFNRFDSSITGFSGASFYKSTNHGVSWSLLSTIAQNVNCLVLSPSAQGTYYAGTNFSLYKSTNAGVSWSVFNDSFTPSKWLLGLSMDQAMGDTLFAVTKDAVYKVWGSYVAVEPISSEIPNEFSLSQNYPNPFNPATNIKFQIPKPGFVKLIAFDMLGKEVDVLVNEELQPGSYEADWNASAYPSGVYYYKLEFRQAGSTTGSIAETKKMVLIK